MALTSDTSDRLGVTRRRLTAWCRRWKVSRLELFGSALRADFGPHSDIDLLVCFKPATRWSLLDHIRMENELADMLGRRVELLTRRAVERSGNSIRREAILGSAKVVYAA